MRLRVPLASTLAAAILLAFASEAAATQAPYTYMALSSLGGDSGANAINNAGQITGYSYSDATVFHAVRWTGSAVTDLGAPSGLSSSGLAINLSGQVAGNIIDAYSPSLTAARWTGTQQITLPSLSGDRSRALGINDAGTVVGYSSGQEKGHQATMWNGTDATLLGSLNSSSFGSTATDINNNGAATGFSYVNGSDDRHAVVWNGGVITDLGTLGGSISYGSGINDAGVVVGYATTSANMDFHATLWNNGTVTDLGTGNMDGAMAADINNKGQAVGFAWTDSTFHAMLWQHGAAIDLNTYLDPTLVSQGWELQTADGINDQGQIVGKATNRYTTATQAFLLSPVPEADGYSMLLAGLGLVGWSARRKKTA
ncbi:HAF repeat-containing protein [Duganella sp. HH105]|uniref:HAF repeat-containing protein n=1 Tax=Duganella sp. HH105 TaxID=1781067 RepID=UPI000877B858|nr:HAF repeat-containing protein [Duganella sp. HH105]OEZ57544.1 hypothetical protein DUGA6_44430 [Duganella sp. HH105]